MARVGNQAPTQSVVLNSSESFEKEAIGYYEKSKRKAQKWQLELTKNILVLS